MTFVTMEYQSPSTGKNVLLTVLVYFKLDSKHISNTAAEPKIGDGCYFRCLRKILWIKRDTNQLERVTGAQ